MTPIKKFDAETIYANTLFSRDYHIKQCQSQISWRLVRIGRGSFASVSILSGRPVAFKHVIVREHSVELKTEFEVLRSLYDSCDTDSFFFGVPRPLAFYDPHSTIFLSAGGSPPSQPCRRPFPLVCEADFKFLELDTAAYAMDQVLPIPLSAAKAIRTLFYPPNISKALDPTLCRLYFGKVIKEIGPGGRPNRFFNSANFPLDVFRYRKLLEVVKDTVALAQHFIHRVRHG